MPRKRPPRSGRRRSEELRHAAAEFNLAWRLLTRRRRTPPETDRMIHAAHASRFHWGQVGTPREWSIGEWQLSHIYATLGRVEPAHFHARRSLVICRQHRVGDFPLAYAYEALARVAALRGDRRAYLRWFRYAVAAAKGIREADDREQFDRDIAAVRLRRRRASRSPSDR